MSADSAGVFGAIFDGICAHAAGLASVNAPSNATFNVESPRRVASTSRGAPGGTCGVATTLWRSAATDKHRRSPRVRGRFRIPVPAIVGIVGNGKSETVGRRGGGKVPAQEMPTASRNSMDAAAAVASRARNPMPSTCVLRERLLSISKSAHAHRGSPSVDCEQHAQAERRQVVRKSRRLSLFANRDSGLRGAHRARAPVRGLQCFSSRRVESVRR